MLFDKDSRKRSSLNALCFLRDAEAFSSVLNLRIYNQDVLKYLLQQTETKNKFHANCEIIV